LAARSTAPLAPDLVHAMMVGRARVLSSPGVDTLRGFVTEADRLAVSRPASMAAVTTLYAGALADAKLYDYGAATKLAGKLSSLVGGDADASRQAGLLSAEIALQSGNPAPALALAPGAGRPELLLSSQARLSRGADPETAQRLQTWLALHPRDAQGWQLLGREYAAQGQQLRAIRADAEAQVAHLDYQAAMDRFRAAQDLARHGPMTGSNYIDASIIDTRARQVESLLREQSLER
ncbi:MAG TPA: peptidase M48, partial [Ramlibacter sp.]|nr:peptidase M48 [Ramlibacter sp.]